MSQRDHLSSDYPCLLPFGPARFPTSPQAPTCTGYARSVELTTLYVDDYSTALASASDGRRCLHYLPMKHVGLASFPCP